MAEQQGFSETKTEAAVVAALAQAAAGVGPRVLTVDDAGVQRRFALLDGPSGQQLKEIAGLGPSMVAPERIQLAVTIETEQSLVDYAAGFKDSGALLLASIEKDRIVAYLDYHAGPDQPGFLGHVATLQLERSLEWKAWAAIDGKLMPQLEFVRFLEENREDISLPDAATILEACRDLQALRKVDFRSVVREDSENYRIEYSNEADARGKGGLVTVPAEFILRLPVYFDGEHIEIHALLRWSVGDDGKLGLGIKLKRAERVRQAVFRALVASVSERTAIEAVYGRLG